MLIAFNQCSTAPKGELVISEWDKVKNGTSPAAVSIFIQENPTTSHFWAAVDRYNHLSDSLGNYFDKGCFKNASVESNGTDVFLFQHELSTLGELSQNAYDYMRDVYPEGSPQRKISINEVDSFMISNDTKTTLLYNVLVKHTPFLTDHNKWQLIPSFANDCGSTTLMVCLIFTIEHLFLLRSLYLNRNCYIPLYEKLV